MNILESDLDQLVSDPSFQRYALSEEHADLAKWQQWLTDNPDKAPAALRARALLRTMEATQQVPSPELIDQQWIALTDRLDTSKPRLAGRRYRLLTVAVIAAACIATLLLVFYSGTWSQSASYQTVYTEYGDLKTIHLPDGSRVTLDANSSLRYSTHWEKDQSREVWLEGEAMFEVTDRPTAGGRSFWVHSGPLQVEVMGTRFGVQHRRQQAEVMLAEGKVLVRSVPGDQQMVLAPGEQAVWGAGDSLQRQQVDPEDYLAWTQRRLIWKEVSLPEIATWITDHYGIAATVIGPQPERPHTFSGEAEVHQLGDLLSLLRALGIDVQQSSDSITLKR